MSLNPPAATVRPDFDTVCWIHTEPETDMPSRTALPGTEK